MSLDGASSGRSVTDLGIDGLSVEEFRSFLMSGQLP